MHGGVPEQVEQRSRHIVYHIISGLSSQVIRTWDWTRAARVASLGGLGELRNEEA